MRTATPTRPAAGLEVVDVGAVLDELDAMTAEELDELDEQNWRDDPDR